MGTILYNPWSHEFFPVVGVLRLLRPFISALSGVATGLVSVTQDFCILIALSDVSNPSPPWLLSSNLLLLCRSLLVSVIFIDLAQPDVVGVRPVLLISVVGKDLGMNFTINGRRHMRLAQMTAVNVSKILHITGSTLASVRKLATKLHWFVFGGEGGHRINVQVKSIVVPYETIYLSRIMLVMQALHCLC